MYIAPVVVSLCLAELLVSLLRCGAQAPAEVAKGIVAVVHRVFQAAPVHILLQLYQLLAGVFIQSVLAPAVIWDAGHVLQVVTETPHT